MQQIQFFSVIEQIQQPVCLLNGLFQLSIEDNGHLNFSNENFHQLTTDAKVFDFFICFSLYNTNIQLGKISHYIVWVFFSDDNIKNLNSFVEFVSLVAVLFLFCFYMIYKQLKFFSIYSLYVIFLYMLSKFSISNVNIDVIIFIFNKMLSI